MNRPFYHEKKERKKRKKAAQKRKKWEEKAKVNRKITHEVSRKFMLRSQKSRLYSVYVIMVLVILLVLVEPIGSDLSFVLLS